MYSIKEEYNKSNHTYKAKITLSKDYYIIDEDYYGDDYDNLDDPEEYKEKYNKSQKLGYYVLIIALALIISIEVDSIFFLNRYVE